MIRRGLFLLALACAAGGCALMEPYADEGPSGEPVAAAPAAESTPDQAYDAGRLAQIRGDYAAARREWDRCLALSAPDSPVRLDCLVALEKSADSVGP